MKTFIDIEGRLLNEAMKITGAATKKEVVNFSLRELVRLSHLKRLKSKIGAGRFALDLKGLKKMRGDG